jgi:hypothetical protein
LPERDDMKKIAGKKYKGWYLERISLDNDLFMLDLARHWLHATEDIGRESTFPGEADFHVDDEGRSIKAFRRRRD